MNSLNRYFSIQMVEEIELQPSYLRDRVSTICVIYLGILFYFSILCCSDNEYWTLNWLHENSMPHTVSYRPNMDPHTATFSCKQCLELLKLSCSVLVAVVGAKRRRMGVIIWVKTRASKRASSQWSFSTLLHTAWCGK